MDRPRVSQEFVQHLERRKRRVRTYWKCISSGYWPTPAVSRGAPRRVSLAIHSGLETAHSTKERFYEPELLRLEGEFVRATETEAERSVALLERAVELARHQGAHLLELRALTSLVHATQDPERIAELLPRVAAVLEQLTLRRESADAREARLLLRGSEGNPAAIP